MRERRETVNQLSGGELECHDGNGGRAWSGDSFRRSQAVVSLLDLA